MASPVSNDRYITCQCLVEALGTAKTRYVASPVNGKVVHILSALDTAVDGDNVLTFAIQGVSMTGGTVTHPSSGSAAGEVRACAPTGANTVKRGQNLSAATDGGGNAGQAQVIFLIEQD